MISCGIRIQAQNGCDFIQRDLKNVVILVYSELNSNPLKFQLLRNPGVNDKFILK